MEILSRRGAAFAAPTQLWRGATHFDERATANGNSRSAHQRSGKGPIFYEWTVIGIHQKRAAWWTGGRHKAGLQRS